MWRVSRRLRRARSRVAFAEARRKFTAEVRPINVGGRSVEVPDEFYRCRNCAEEYYHPGMLDTVLNRAIARAREEDQGVVT